ncbi:MAG: AAA family ATPase, partial [Thermoguttaceae bacterium]|nr:AAA family ATPase [Thermoguttaceae bacterium]
MKITALEVDGFGVWTGLRLDGLSDGLNVFFGPNEAGKTTLVQFVRAMLYGFSPERRGYLPPVYGGAPGGRLVVTGPGGRFDITRRPGPDGALDELAIVAADGARQGEHVLRALLADLDEPIFRNVFAVGLEELQELSTLNATEAAALLYNLSAGLDRVSLVEVMRELQASRNRLFDAGGGPSQIAQLAAQRDKLRAEIEEAGELTRRYGRLAAERDQIDREAARLEEEARQLALQCRTMEIALAVRERWIERRSLDEQLAALGPVDKMPDGAAERFEAIESRRKEHQERFDELRRRRASLGAEARRVVINEALWRLAPRVEALAEQESWIGTLETRIHELEADIAQAESRLAEEQKRFGVAGQWPSVSPRSLAALRRPAAAMRQARRRLEDARREVAGNRDHARTLAGQIEAVLSSRGERDLADATERLSG